jgi:hypothetical protein
VPGSSARSAWSTGRPLRGQDHEFQAILPRQLDAYVGFDETAVRDAGDGA